MGKAIWESSIGTWLGTIFKLGMYICQPSRRTILICVRGRYQNGRQNRKHETDLENSDERRWSGRTNPPFLDHVFVGCTHRECTTSNDIATNYRDMIESRISASAQEKLLVRASGKPDAETISSWSYDLEGHAKKCVEIYCELANKTTQQLHKVAPPCMDDHQFKEEKKWVSRRIVYSLLTNCSQMSVSGSYWETWHFVVCEQTCACDHKMDKSLWQTLGAFDLVHSSRKWVPTILLCGKHTTTLSIGSISRLWFCRRPRTLKINIRKSSVHFRESHVCANKLDVQETNFSFTQLYRSGNFLLMQVYAWTVFLLSLFGI